MTAFRTLVCVHGAGSGPWAFDAWEDAFPDLELVRVDLQEGLDVAHATMRDYAAAVVRGADGRKRPLAVCGWSLGGLASLLAAAEVRPEALILLEASPPLEIQGLREVVPTVGTFVPEHAPDGLRVRPESSFAMGERDRGVSVPALPPGTRLLAVAGTAYREERGLRPAEIYGAELLDVGDVAHRDLVRDPAVRALVAGWLSGLPRRSES